MVQVFERQGFLDMISGSPKFGAHPSFLKKCRVHHGHEAYLPTVQDPPRPHARLFGAYEDAGRPSGHQCAPRQGAQASVPGLSLTGRPAAKGFRNRCREACPAGHSTGETHPHPMIGCLVQAADFKRLLSAPPALRSAHFVIHHLVEAPTRAAYERRVARKMELSTGHEPRSPQPVDDSEGKPHEGHPGEGMSAQGLPRWMGCVVPKRHARRAVTRNLLKRQMRAAAQRVEGRLPGGLWLVRLRQPFAAADFPSAASQALRAAARTELDRLFQKAASAPTEAPCTAG